MRAMEDFIVAQGFFYTGFKGSEDSSGIEEFDLEFARMDIDIDHVAGDVDTNDRKWIFAMSDLSMIAVHDRFL